MIARSLSRISTFTAAVERLLLTVLVLVIAAFVLVNVLLRMIGITIAWADEIAVYAMILSGFVGASLMLRARIDPAMLLVHEVLKPRAIRALNALVSIISAAFGLTLFFLCWLWFDPLAMVAAGFDVATFEAATFNFIYTDTMPVTAIPTFWFYLIMPWFAATVTVHAATNLCEDLGWIARPEDPAGLRMEEVGT